MFFFTSMLMRVAMAMGAVAADAAVAFAGLP